MPRPKADSEAFIKKRSEVVTVRLDPRIKYLAELAARKQRRTLSGFIEFSVEQSLERVILRDGKDYGDALSVTEADRSFNLWDVDEPERVIRLGIIYPELLTYEEQVIWKIVKECEVVWGSYLSAGGDVKPRHTLDSIKWDLVRYHWNTFQQVAMGKLPRDSLPKSEDPFDNPGILLDDDFNDEIPY